MANHSMTTFLARLRKVACLQEADGLTDGQLVDRYVTQRDEAAFEVLVRRHGPMVLGVCCRLLANQHDAEDAFQATFLILVRKATSIVPREMIGNWLYGTAYLTALKARAGITKRYAREKQVKTLPEPATVAEGIWHDLVPLLDQELTRLPAKFRLAVVLCDLEGKTRKQAARQLCWPEGTVAGRLARGRALLAKRLSRHGLTLSGGTLAAMLSQEASASVPTSLLISTLKAVSLFTAGQAVTAGLISAEVAALTEGVMTTMFLSKIKVAMAVLLVAAALVTGTGVMISQGSGPDAQEKKSLGSTPDTEKNADPSAQAPPKAGKAAASAGEIGSVYLTNAALADEKFAGKQVAVSGKMKWIRAAGETFLAAGKRFSAKEDHKYLYVLEMNSGAASDPFLLLFHFTDDDRTQLAKLKAGQVLTIEGKPRRAPLVSTGDREIIIHFDDCKILKAEDAKPNP